MDVTQRLILPYDDSPLARAALCHAARVASRGNPATTELLVAVAGVEPDVVEDLAQRLRRLARPEVGFTLHLLPAGEPLVGFRVLARAHPDAFLVAPLTVDSGAPWYREACRFQGLAHPVLLVIIGRRDVAAARRIDRARRGVHVAGWLTRVIRHRSPPTSREGCSHPARIAQERW